MSNECEYDEDEEEDEDDESELTCEDDLSSETYDLISLIKYCSIRKKIFLPIQVQFFILYILFFN